MPTWPAYAAILFDGYAEEPEPAVIRTEMESGPAKQAMVRSLVTIQRPVKALITSNADYQSFMTWFRTDIKRGALWFDWTDPVDGQVKQARIVGGKIDPRPQRKDMSRWHIGLRIETWG